MARRQLLTVDERRRLFDPPADETAIIRHYTLSSEDMELAGRRYGPANRLGLAAQVALMRHPGFGLQAETGVPGAILQYLAAQLLVDPAAFELYGQRARKRGAIMATSWRAISGCDRSGTATLRLLWHWR